jgi:hypothetical protein
MLINVNVACKYREGAPLATHLINPEHKIIYT